ncbi:MULTISPECIES: type VI secretion system protein TssL, long form [Vibrio]|uniref:type VI secretion system protein TssL, long form n=1 Tax=Vibrio TaxID=662 RepID=UPI000470491F|nr:MULTISPECIES: type VI secretion system protein TssL, long form [Vibrio]MBS9833066.1 type VI secretion system protein TssL, long form [Vibrio alginolyticus]MDA0099457.1 type VI secretion system protein TssL, long form [Vibrio sp. ART SEL2]ULF71933.1 type VI secretion system protein TssL, long form [Vibrio alginolyticus]
MEQTIVKPTPGGRAPASKPQSEKSVDNTVVISKSPELVNNDSVVAYGSNSLLAEANGLLSIIGQIRSTATHSDPLFLKETLAQKLRDYENRLRQHDVDLDTIDTARYCLCCSLDEVVLNTNWGGHSFWSHDSLLSSFYASSQGGEAFFKHLDKCMAKPDANLDLLELMYVCLSLGFLGQYRLEKNGLESHRKLRRQVIATLKSYGRGVPQELSNSIDQHILNGSKASDRAPLWVVCSVTAALLVCVYMYFSYELNKASNRTFSQLVNLIQPQQLNQDATSESKSAPIAEKISMYLATEIGKGLINVEPLQDRVRISLKSQDLFESGSADVVAYIQPVISKLARTLESTQGKIIVTGHTDDRPIFTSKYPSNWHLSLARATAMSEQLISNSALEGRVIPEGLGDARPLVENSSDENRAINRRIEIDLLVAN